MKMKLTLLYTFLSLTLLPSLTSFSHFSSSFTSFPRAASAAIAKRNRVQLSADHEKEGRWHCLLQIAFNTNSCGASCAQKSAKHQIRSYDMSIWIAALTTTTRMCCPRCHLLRIFSENMLQFVIARPNGSPPIQFSLRSCNAVTTITCVVALDAEHVGA